MKNCLVLGAGGYIGKNLCQKLVESCNVRAFDKKGLEELKNIEGIEIVYGDFLSMSNFSELLKGVDTVYHLICTTIPNEDTHNIPCEIQENLIPLTRLLDSLILNDIDKFVFVSSAGTVYGEAGKGEESSEDDFLNPICSYGVLKEVSEAYIRFYNTRYHKNYRIARVSNPYGIGQDKNRKQGLIPVLINHLYNCEPITIWGDGENVRDYIYMQDINQIEQQTGLKFREIHYVEARSCDVHNNRIDLRCIERELNWTAQTSLEEGIKKIISLHERK